MSDQIEPIKIAAVNTDVLAEAITMIDNVIQQYEAMTGLKVSKVERDIHTNEYLIHTVTSFSPKGRSKVNG